MTHPGRGTAVALLVAAVLGLEGASARPVSGPAGVPPVHAEAPPPGHTGGFGEPTCRACHEAFELNPQGGRFSLEGVPADPVPGRRYALTLRLEVPETTRSGFQLSARTPDGRQAGAFHPLDAHAAVTASADGKVSYAHHTLAGSTPDSPEISSWTVEWEAPEVRGPVVFHAAANSADGDNSPFGDLIYALERRVGEGR